ncbi:MULTISPECIES: glycosyltransferase family A protein [Pseudomonas]|uniref:Glycosyltransferase n=1 Tax=Pseudomonas helleri TaxID=1608996 RepID=A0A7X1WVQ4_9PSED|nr:glycosyltransferase family A protein [Pseudomonas helleri]MQT75614.1 glycosyltransferase [Pseudomonas helleri]
MSQTIIRNESLASATVCVVIPFYNRSCFSERLLWSIRNQTLQPDTIYLVDNGSSLKEIASLHATIESIGWGNIEIILISTLKTGNANYARNLGFELATTKYVAFLDSDDWWEPNHLATSLDYLSSSKKGAIYSGAIIHKNGIYKNHSIDVNLLNDPFSIFVSRKGYIAQTSSYIINKEMCQGQKWDETLKRHQDYDFFLSIYYFGPGWAFSSTPTSNIDWEDGGAKSKPEFRSMVRFLKKWIQHISSGPLRTYLTNQILLCIRSRSKQKYLNYYLAIGLNKNFNPFIFKAFSCPLAIFALSKAYKYREYFHAKSKLLKNIRG